MVVCVLIYSYKIHENINNYIKTCYIELAQTRHSKYKTAGRWWTPQM